MANGSSYFVVALQDAPGGEMTWEDAMSKYRLPDKAQGRVMAERASEISSAISDFGGTPLGRFYWTSAQKNDKDAWQIDVDGGYLYGFRMTNNCAVRPVL